MTIMFRETLGRQRKIVTSSFVMGMAATVLTAFVCYVSYALFYPEGLNNTLGMSIPVILPALVAPPVAGLLFYHVDTAATERTKRKMLIKQLQQETERRRRAEAELARTVQRDPLTGLATREHFVSHLRKALSRAKRYRRPISVVMVGIDGFTVLNQEHGHEGGDLILTQVADALRRELREEDFAARHSDDRFIFLLEETTLEGARVAADRIRAAIADTSITMPDQELKVTASFGVAEVNAAKQTVEDSVAWGEHALGHAQQAGAGKVCIVREPALDDSGAPTASPATEVPETSGPAAPLERAAAKEEASANAPKRRATDRPATSDSDEKDTSDQNQEWGASLKNLATAE